MMTTLQISGVGFPPYSIDRCTQTLEAIPQGPFVRTIEGTLVFVGTPLHHKYKSVIQGEDMNAPTLSMVPCGQKVLVHCIQSLWQEALKAQVILARPATPNTVSAIDTQGEAVDITLEDSNHIKLEGEDISFPVFVQYYPLLTMLVRSFSLERNENNNHTKWRIELEEV